MAPLRVYDASEVKSLVRTIEKTKKMGTVRLNFKLTRGRFVFEPGLHELATLRWAYEIESELYALKRRSLK